MNLFLNKFLSLLGSDSQEYLIVDQDLNILDISPGVKRFADCPSEVQEGKDVRAIFPELIGMEETIIAILEEQETSFKLNSIGHFPKENSPIYFNILIIKDKITEPVQKQSIILFEDVTETMLLEQKLVQSSNETSLLLSALSASKAYIDKIITSMADALFVTTYSGEIKTVNQATENLFGYSQTELVGQPITIIFSEEVFLNGNFAQELSSDKFFHNVEVICQTKTGEKLGIAFSCSVLPTDNKDIQEFIYVGRDITERQRQRQRLAIQYSVTHILSESATWSEAIPKILEGIGENLGWDFAAFWQLDTPPPDQPHLERLTNNIVSSQLSCVDTWIRPSLNPESIYLTSQIGLSYALYLANQIWASCSPHWITDLINDADFYPEEVIAEGELHAAFGFPILDDLEIMGVIVFFSSEVQHLDQALLQLMSTIGSQIGQFIKRKQAEAALLEREEQYRDLFENASDLIQSVTPEGCFLYVNRAWREILGYSETEIAQISLFDIIHPQCQVDYREIMQRLTSGEKIEAIKLEFITKGRKKISVEGNINCKFVEGKPVATRGIFRDITTRLEAEEALRDQQETTERLLLNILPAEIAKRLKQRQQPQEEIIADNFAEVTVLFADIVGFTELSAQISAADLVGILNVVFSRFDQLTQQHGLEKIKTIGDAYMVVGGLPVPKPNHAEAIADMALEMQATMARFRDKVARELNIRIGVNTGPVVAGVIGIQKFSYDLWGDTVNIASRMESHGLPGQIQVSTSTYEQLHQRYLLKRRGEVAIKGKGAMTTYLLLGKK
ncbi:MAG: adenylate/guanylate cyclase domain-containing protein [Coleofasciculaceae cyanobacterium]